jgi:hypothetical protein
MLKRMRRTPWFENVILASIAGFLFLAFLLLRVIW